GRGMSPGFGSLALTGLLAVPAGGAIILATIPRFRVSAALNVAVCALTLASAAALYAHRPEPSLYLLVDDVNTVFLLVGGLVGFTTSLFSAGYIAHELETRRLKSGDLRFYHAMYQLLMFAMNLALVANNIGLMWVAIELATLTTVVMVGLYRTHAALNVALFALLRFKLIMAGNAQVLSPGPMMVTMGLVSLVFAGFMLYRRRDIKRMFAYSSIEHMGIITLAFGLGGPIASFAGLLHM